MIFYMEKGKFITIYGINNIGKSTQSKILVRKLKKAGYKACYVKYPVYDIEPSGSFINKILRSSGKQKISENELQLWFVLNRYQFQPTLKNLLKKGYIVIAEDYIGTGIAWGTAKGLDQKWVEEINESLLKEDFSILIEGERNLVAKEKKHVHEQNDKLINDCIKVHSKLADKYGWKRVQLQKNILDTSNIIFRLVSKKISGRLS